MPGAESTCSSAQIGDCFMACSGILHKSDDHLVRMAKFAISCLRIAMTTPVSEGVGADEDGPVPLPPAASQEDAFTNPNFPIALPPVGRSRAPE